MISGVTSQSIDKGNHRHFMHEGNLRTADRRRADAEIVPPPARGSGRAAADRIRSHRHHPRHDRRMRHQFLCRHGRQILVRAVRAGAGRHRCRLRIPLPRAGAGAGRAGAVHLAIGRNRRHARRAAPRPRRRPEDRGRGQRADQQHGARGRPAAADACRAGDRRRLDQGVRLPARGPGRARRALRAGEGADHARGRARDRPPPDRSPGRAQRRARRTTRRSRRWRR